MTRFLEIEYLMTIQNWRQQAVYVRPFNEFVELKKGHLPDVVHFVADGAGSPAEDEARAQRKFNSAQAAIQLDTIAMQSGRQPSVDIQALIQELLKDGGWTDPTAITVEQQEVGEAEQGQLPGLATAPPESLL